jgi:AraC-like DNA-binding protein
MSIKLKNIRDWPELAKQAQWSATELAGLCAVSTTTLRRYFWSATGKSAGQWLAEERQRQALALLRDGSSIKEIASCLGYKKQTNFTRKFKEYWGICPTTARNAQVSRHSARK